MGIFSAKVSKTKMDLLATRRQEHISVSLSNQNGMVMAENRLAFSSITFLPGKTGEVAIGLTATLRKGPSILFYFIRPKMVSWSPLRATSAVS